MNPIITKMKKDKTFQAWVQGNESLVEEGQNETEAIARLLLRLQGRSIRTWSGPFYLACACWLSVFVEAWLLLTGHIQSNGTAWGLWIFFFLMGIFSSSLAMRK
jgi:hypothetical protein